MSYSLEIKPDNFGRLWFIYKEPSIVEFGVIKKTGIKVSIALESISLYLKGNYKSASIRRPRLIVKQGAYHSVDGFEYTKGPFVGSGTAKKCHRIVEKYRVQLKAKVNSDNELENTEREVRMQRGLATISPHFCPIVYAYIKASRKGNFQRCVVYIAKGYDRTLLHFPLYHLELHKVFLRIAEAIQAAHFNNVVLGDLKEGNILYSKGGKIALTDLESAFKVDRRPKTYVTTLAYASPESLTKSHSMKHDIFSFGIIIFIKAIRFIYPSKNISHLKSQLNKVDFQKRYIDEILKFRKDIPKTSPYYDLLQDMLRPNANQRPNIDSVLERLEKLTPLFAGTKTALNKS